MLSQLQALLMIHKVGKAQWISSWDTTAGYWQLLVKPEHRWLTAFITNYGLFEWIRMPFGLKCASNSFEFYTRNTASAVSSARIL